MSHETIHMKMYTYISIYLYIYIYIYIYRDRYGTRGKLVGVVYGPGGLGTFPESIVVDSWSA